MRNTYFMVESALLLLVQVLIWNFLNLTPFVVLCFLPTIVLCLPIDTRPVISMLIALLISYLADFFTHGILGLTAVALLPVAYSRRFIIRLVFGSELFARGEDICFSKQGPMKMTLAITFCTVLFFLIYVWVDSAGMRTFGFNALRFFFSSVASILLSVGVSALLTSDAQWR